MNRLVIDDRKRRKDRLAGGGAFLKAYLSAPAGEGLKWSGWMV